MIKSIAYFTSVIIVTGLILGAVWFFSQDAEQQKKYLSPLPDMFVNTKDKKPDSKEVWLPLVKETHGNENSIANLTAKSILIYDLSTNKTILEKNAKNKMPMASLTKIMTAVVSIENPRDDNSYYVNGNDIVGENSMGLEPGEVLTQEELLYGLLLMSGNDAAEVLAANSPLGRQGFIDAMNEKVKDLGLSDTHFDNPTGLQGDGLQYTTAYDLLVITKYALDYYPLFADIVATSTVSLPKTTLHKEYTLNNETNLLSTYEGVKGVKTGYTPEAGLCLVTYLDYSGHKIIGIILNSENRRGEMKQLLDYSLKSLGIEPPIYKG